VIRLADEVDLLEPLLAAASTPAYLVGHSYGGAIALKAARCTRSASPGCVSER